jgi:exodeoxyribonuclease X
MIYVVDTETTSVEKPEVIELAWLQIGFPITVSSSYEQRFRPKGAISYGAMAVHHILPQELENKPAAETASLPPDTTYIIGHNVDFDYNAIPLKPPGIKRICTLAIARALFPTLDTHMLGALTYFFATGNREAARESLQKAHNALADVGLCLGILGRLLNSVDEDSRPQTIEALWEFSEDCRIPRVMAFGKYKGQKIKDIPRDYMSWAARQADFDPYVLKAFQLAKEGRL